ncbi:MAG: DegT/DnrJ/EryC1/StrS family aminotransferase [Anaerolineae bacterium]|nr:DegT/DnrJ/EryC1/StrS family aminotransferase [Anaerolineae bacterium]
MRIPMSSPDITAAEIEAVNQVLQTPFLSIGPRIAEFEERFAAYVGARHAVGVSNGTAGLHLGVIAAGIGEGDLVITTPFSFVASANVILYEHAIPIFVDVDERTGNIDPALVAEAAHKLTRACPELVEGRQGDKGRGRQGERETGRQGDKGARGRLKAVLPVHVFGQPADMDAINAVAQEYGLTVIEDACEALGAEYKGRRIGTQPVTPALSRVEGCDLRLATVFAFYPNKQITTGEGGMIVTDNDEWADLFRSLRNQGRDVHDAWLNHSRLGYNYRLDEMSAALGLAQLGRIEELLAKRERVAQWYSRRLKDVEGVQVPYIAPTTTRMSWFVYVIRLAPAINRSAVMAALEERGIPSRPYFTPIHLQPFYRERLGTGEGDFPVAEAVARSSLALPFSGVMTEEQVEYVCTQLIAVVRQQLQTR